MKHLLTTSHVLLVYNIIIAISKDFALTHILINSSLYFLLLATAIFLGLPNMRTPLIIPSLDIIRGVTV